MSLRDALRTIGKQAALALWTLIVLATTMELLSPGSVSAFFSFLWLIPPGVLLVLLIPNAEPRPWLSLVWSVPLAILLGLVTAAKTSELGRSSLFLGMLVGVTVVIAAFVLARKRENK